MNWLLLFKLRFFFNFYKKLYFLLFYFLSKAYNSYQVNVYHFDSFLINCFNFISAILVYRALRNMRKQKLKVIHACIHTAVVVCVIIALVAVFDSHNYTKPNPIPNLYSLHSWIGLITVIAFFFQVCFLHFLFPSLIITGLKM